MNINRYLNNNNNNNKCASSEAQVCKYFHLTESCPGQDKRHANIQAIQQPKAISTQKYEKTKHSLMQIQCT